MFIIIIIIVFTIVRSLYALMLFMFSYYLIIIEAFSLLTSRQCYRWCYSPQQWTRCIVTWQKMYQLQFIFEYIFLLLNNCGVTYVIYFILFSYIELYTWCVVAYMCIYGKVVPFKHKRVHVFPAISVTQKYKCCLNSTFFVFYQQERNLYSFICLVLISKKKKRTMEFWNRNFNSKTGFVFLKYNDVTIQIVWCNYRNTSKSPSTWKIFSFHFTVCEKLDGPHFRVREFCGFYLCVSNKIPKHKILSLKWLNKIFNWLIFYKWLV